MVGVDHGVPEAVHEVAPGVVHIAIPFDDRISLDVDGRSIEPRTGFGVTTAFDIELAGIGELGYERDQTRSWWLASQLTLWFVVFVVAVGFRASFVRRRATTAHDETLIDLDSDWVAEHEFDAAIARQDVVSPVAGEVLDPSGPIERLEFPDELDDPMADGVGDVSDVGAGDDGEGGHDGEGGPVPPDGAADEGRPS